MIWTISSRASPLPPGNWCDALSTVWAKLAAGRAQSAAATATVDDNFLMVSSDNLCRAFISSLKELNFPSIVKASVAATQRCAATAGGSAISVKGLSTTMVRGERLPRQRAHIVGEDKILEVAGTAELHPRHDIVQPQSEFLKAGLAEQHHGPAPDQVGDKVARDLLHGRFLLLLTG